MKILLVKDPHLVAILAKKLEPAYLVLATMEIEKAIEVYEV